MERELFQYLSWYFLCAEADSAWAVSNGRKSTTIVNRSGLLHTEYMAGLLAGFLEKSYSRCV